MEEVWEWDEIARSVPIVCVCKPNFTFKSENTMESETAVYISHRAIRSYSKLHLRLITVTTAFLVLYIIYFSELNNS
jgi:hypothetical protein